ncbi:MAG: hypothetical protein K5779_04700 [Saccharofermentans sp.]|nr:hypothetical protein [Saccharofermentans sp.]
MWEDSKEMLKSFDLNMLEKTYPNICPICGVEEKHVFFYRFDDEDNDGGVWMWCSKCHSYTHAHVVIPSNWKNPDFISEEVLDDSVDYLETNKDKIDEWVNKLKL